MPIHALPPALSVLDTTPATAFIRFKERRLDECAFQKYGDALTRIPEEMPGRWVTLDLGNVVALNCTWLGLFITLGQELRATGGHLCIRDVDARVYEVFLLTRLTDVLDVRAKGPGVRANDCAAVGVVRMSVAVAPPSVSRVTDTRTAG